MKTRDFTTEGGVTFTAKNLSVNGFKEFRALQKEGDMEGTLDAFVDKIVVSWSLESEPTVETYGDEDFEDVIDVMDTWLNWSTGEDSPLGKRSKSISQ